MLRRVAFLRYIGMQRFLFTILLLKSLICATWGAKQQFSISTISGDNHAGHYNTFCNKFSGQLRYLCIRFCLTGKCHSTHPLINRKACLNLERLLAPLLSAYNTQHGTHVEISVGQNGQPGKCVCNVPVPVPMPVPVPTQLHVSRKCPLTCIRRNCNRCLRALKRGQESICLPLSKTACLRGGGGQPAGIWCGDCVRQRTLRKCARKRERCSSQKPCCDCDCFKNGQYPAGCINGTCQCKTPQYAFCHTTGDCPANHCSAAKPGLAKVACVRGSCECVADGKCIGQHQ